VKWKHGRGIGDIMRIGFDARFLTHPQRGGFKTYTENLISALATVDKENEYILYVDRSPIKRKLMAWYHRFIPELAARRASAIVTVSHFSKETIVTHLGVSPDQVFVIYEAADSIYRKVESQDQIATALRKYNLTPGGFIFAIGSADPRKNMTALVRAYALLPISLRERHRLTILWTHGLLASDLAEEVETLGITGHVQFLESVPTEELVLLYNGASLFVFPSLHEGFGLPLLEAMACGTPVVASRNSSIPEIAGDAALLADAEDVASLASLIAMVLIDKTLQERLSLKGLERAACFSWEKCASDTIAVYRRLVSQ
jgi:glycosyltransferase involved in cell wall biosynthesis